jgi:hypothetical protein
VGGGGRAPGEEREEAAADFGVGQRAGESIGAWTEGVQPDGRGGVAAGGERDGRERAGSGGRSERHTAGFVIRGEDDEGVAGVGAPEAKRHGDEAVVVGHRGGDAGAVAAMAGGVDALDFGE